MAKYNYGSDYMGLLDNIIYEMSEGGTVEKARSFKRDNAGRVTKYCDTDMLSGSSCDKETPTDVAYEYSYDAVGRVTQFDNLYLKSKLSASDHKIEYEWDQFGNRTAMALTVDGSTEVGLQYSYDSMDHITTIADEMLSGDTIGFDFLTSGRIDEIYHMNGTWTEMDYDSSEGSLSYIDHLVLDGGIEVVVKSFD